MGTKITPSPITADHWWDGLTPFDDFTGVNGSAVDPTKWDTSVTNATIEIQGNNCRMRGTWNSNATLTLKNAITSGKIIAITVSLNSNTSEVNSFTAALKYYVGNAIQGYTLVTTNTLSTANNVNDLDSTHSEDYTPSLEAIYIGGNQWNIYLGNNPYAGNPVALANGLKIRFNISHTDTASSAHLITFIIKEVYID